MLILDKPLGQVVMGGVMMAKGSGEEHWKKTLFVQKNSIQMWHEVSMVNPPIQSNQSD